MKLAVALFPALALAGNISLTVAGISVTPQRWDKQANLATFERYARMAAGQKAELILAPEGFLEGYVANVHANPSSTREKYFEIGENIDGAPLTRVRALARELKVYLGLGFAERRKNQMFNSVAVFSPQGDLALHYSKAHNNDDEPWNSLGTEFPVADTPLGRWGALICYDRQLPETARVLSVKGAQLVLVPSWGSYGDMNDAMMRTRAFENSVWLMFVHPKQTLVIDPRGKIIARNEKEGDQIVTARIELDDRVGKGAIRSRRPAIYGDILK